MKNLIAITIISLATIFGSMSFAQTKLAHVDTQSVLDTMPSRKAASKEVERFKRKAMEELQETQMKLQSDFETLQREQETMSKTAYKFEEERLMRKSQDFQERQQELERQIQTLGAELNEPILKKVQEAVEIVAKKHKLNYVIDESSLLYGDGLDLTEEVVKEVLRMEEEEANQSDSDE